MVISLIDSVPPDASPNPNPSPNPGKRPSPGGEPGAETPIASASPPLRILFFLRSLGHGGTERQLSVLAKGLHGRGHDIRVVPLYAGGPFAERLSEAGVPVVPLDKSSRWDLWRPHRQLLRLVQDFRPHIVHAFLPAQNMTAALLKGRLHPAKLVLGVRAAFMDLAAYDPVTRLAYAAEARLGRRADLIIANSRAGRDWAVSRGMPVQRLAVIPNGIDTERFQPNAEAGARLRTTLGLQDASPLIAIVGRLDPMKDHETFLAAAAHCRDSLPQARFLVVGPDVAGRAAMLRVQAEALGLGERIVWAGPRDDVAAVWSAADLATLTSAYGEGFPNVVGEAMACGRLVVATETGDAAAVIGTSGAVVPPQQAEALAAAWIAQAARLQQDRTALATAARRRIEENFSETLLIQRTEAELQRLYSMSHLY